MTTCTLLRTIDGFAVFGKRGKVHKQGAIDLIVGMLERDELPILEGKDIERNMLKELEEETNIPTDSIKDIKLLGIAISPSSNTAFVFDTLLKLTRSEVEEIFTSKLQDETEELVFILEDQLDSFLKDFDGYKSLIPEMLK